MSKMPVRVFSTPIDAKSGGGSEVDRPLSLEDDDTAFAFTLREQSLLPVIRPGAVLYASRLMHPAPGSLAVFVTKQNEAYVRVVSNQIDDGFEIFKLQRTESGSFETVSDVVGFEDLAEIAVITHAGLIAV